LDYTRGIQVTILTVNAGSSSIRLNLFTTRADRISNTAAFHHQADNTPPAEILENFIRDNKPADITLISHRIVHGGIKLIASCYITLEVEREIERLSGLAPLHNPIALLWIRACRNIFGPQVPQVAVFDTAFFAALPELAAIYPIPKDLCIQYEIRRYGFHGLAHRAMYQRWVCLRPDLEDGGRLITLQLGAGCSISAINRGTPVDTSMGFSPLEGLMMATRSGDIDPSIILYLQQSAGLTVNQIDQLVNKASGLLGVSGISKDMQVLLESDHPDAKLAIALYCYRIKKYIGAYQMILAGVDGIVFGGGVGENSPLIRELILKNMNWCGIILDPRANEAAIGKEALISAQNSQSELWTIPVDESAVLAHEAMHASQSSH
jgi:acetate kinase